jgi:hypothetical protein
MGIFTKFKFPWHVITTHRIAFTLYALFALFILASGVVMCSLSLMWLFPYATETYTGVSVSVVPTTVPINVAGSLTKTKLTEAVSYLNLVLTSTDITLALVLGVLCCATFFAALPAYMTTATTGLINLCFLLPIEALAMVGSTGFIWFRTLKERANFFQVWTSGGFDVQMAIQDKWQCCGYWDSSSAALGSQCAIATPAMPACVDPFQQYGDALLSSVTTFLFTVAAIMGFWILVNLCLIAEVSLRRTM